jgi:hypothetical protein
MVLYENSVSEILDDADTSNQMLAGNTVPEVKGKLMVSATPWADVYINNRKINTTPLKNHISLAPGRYTLKLVHPDYPEYQRRITVNADKTENISVNFKDLAGYLDCKVYPWGEIYIDDVLKSQTPLREPIVLMPGKYKLTIKNPQYGSVSETITITSRNINEFRYNFENHN